MASLQKLVQWIYTLLFSALMLLLAVMSTGWKAPLSDLYLALDDINQRWLLAIIGIILFVLGIYALFNNLRAKPVQNTIVKTTQLGDVCVSHDAIEALVVKAAAKVSGIREIKPVIKLTEQGIAILIKGTVNSEENIPQISAELQEAVKNNIEAIAGVAVIEVRVFIQGITREMRGRVE